MAAALVGLCQVPARAGVTGYLSDGQIEAWGFNSAGETSVPAGTFVAVAAGGAHSLAVRSDGSVAAWGWNAFGQTNAPPGTYSQVAAGVQHSLGLRSDGAVVGWGWDTSGQASPPVGSFTQVAAAYTHSVALRTDGTVAAWGSNAAGQLDLAPGTYLQIAAGEDTSLGLRTDGTLAGAGSNLFGQLDLPAGTFTQVAAGTWHGHALREDGTIAAWGDNSYGQTNAPSGSFTRLAGGQFHTLALRADGTIEAWGYAFWGALAVPPGHFYVDMAAGGKHSLGLWLPQTYDDLVVDNVSPVSTYDTTLQRDVTTTGDATIQALLTLVGSPTLTVGGRTKLTSTGGIRGGGTILGDVRADYGSSIQATADLTLGDANSFTGFVGQGDVEVGSHTVTLNSRVMGKVGSLVSLDGGNLVVPHGFVIDPTSMLVGTGTVDGRVINQGLIAAGDPGEDLTFNHLVSGAGSFTGSLIFNGGFSPGNSPASAHLDWVTFGAGNTLNLELGGLLSGSEYDQLSANYGMNLGGTLDVAYLSGFQAQLGDTFDLFDGAFSGQFAQIHLPSLGNGLFWDLSDLYGNGILSVTNAAPAVPEPGTWAILLLGLAAARRRRDSRWSTLEEST